MTMGRRELLKKASAVVASASYPLVGSFRDAVAEDKNNPIPVRGVSAAPGLSFSALFVASAAGLWAKNGLDYHLKLVQGGLPAFAALTSGEADFACIVSSDPLVAWEKGIKTLVVAAFTQGVAMQFGARNDWMAKVGIKPSDPLDARVKALKDARIGVGTIGSGPAQYVKYLASLSGLAEREVKLLPVGLGAARIAALRENQVDVIVGSAPDADEVALQGFGDLYINCATEVPAFKDFPYTVLVVSAAFAAAKPDVVHRLAHSVGQANDFIGSNLAEATRFLKAEFPKINPQAIERSMQRDKDTFPPGARMTESMWANALEVARRLKTVKDLPPVSEGAFWTNKYL
jgi:NitT/TauT family transport system substrate-binding protein